MKFDDLQNRGVLYGDGIFETMRVGPKGVWEMDAHIRRLEKTTAYFGLEKHVDTLVSSIRKLKTKENCLVRLTVLREGIESPLPGHEGGFFWNQRPLPIIPSPKLVGLKGLYLPGYALHEFKTTSYLRSIHCKNLAIEKGYTDGLMLSECGHVGETSTCNIWAVFDGFVVTPNLSGILPGIVRGKILGSDLGGLRIEERALKTTELFNAKEIAMSSVGVGLVAAQSFHYDGRCVHLENNWSRMIADELFDGW